MVLQRNPQAGTWKLPEGYRDIGWQLTIENPDLKKHYDAKHKSREFDNSLYIHRCTDVVTICDECKIVWHTDMSD